MTNHRNPPLRVLLATLLVAPLGLAFAADRANPTATDSAPDPAVPAIDERPAAHANVADANVADADIEGILPLDDLRAFVEVFDRIRSAYVEEVDDRTLLENAIRGMLDSLDPHSAYLAHDDFSDLQDATSGSFGGVGIEVGFENGQIKVITPIDGTPAERAGVQAGDVIIELDATPVADMSLAEAIDSMRGKPGTGVRMTVKRDGSSEPIEFDLVRDLIEVASVRQRLLEPGFGYLRVSQFQERTGRDVATALDDLQQDAGGRLDGIVLDLRNNPGGVLQASVQVADVFLARGRIVYTEGRLAGAEVSYNANGVDQSNGTPLVVLINEGSASAAEIVAGALQDHRRAVVMGTPSFGKGSVQTVLPLSGERGIKLTTALYYTPGGRSIQAQGIAPDITVDRGTVRASEAEPRTREADLRGHLGNAGAGAETPAPLSALASDDYQLAEALNLLKGMHLLSLRTGGE